MGKPPGVVIDRRYLDHQPGIGHPERPERLAALLDLIDGPVGEGLVRIEPRRASTDELATNHTAAHIEGVAISSGQPNTIFDGDTAASAGTYEAALLAAGGFLNLLDAIMAGEVENGLALVRPPGHHAESSHAMGFCLFNNVAVGARHLRRRHGIERVLIVDYDVHHGNGTQHSFEIDPDVLYVSIHQYPFYPGTGGIEEVGVGDGAGRTVNVPLPGGCGDDDYREAFRTIIDPIMREFDPEFVLVSAGFDADGRDPLATMHVTESGFRDMTRRLLAVAREHANGRCAAILEGGYDLGALRENTAAVFDEMAHDRPPENTPCEPTVPGVLAAVREVQARYWTLPD
jgi:acetoin utilization deacetylase AcuC-like enzyme